MKNKSKYILNSLPEPIFYSLSVPELRVLWTNYYSGIVVINHWGFITDYGMELDFRQCKVDHFEEFDLDF